MRKLVAAAFSAIAMTAVIASPVNANSSPPTLRGASSRLSLTAKITSFRATASGVVANGTLTGKLSSGTSVSRQSAPVSFAVAAASSGARCNVITLRLAPLNLELLGVQVTTSNISLDVYALHGRVLGNLFCALARAKVTLPRAASDAARALNSQLRGRPLQVFTASQSLPASAAQAQPQTCQVLKLVLGPLHLDLLGLVVDLYGKTHVNPVVVTINAIPSQGLLGQLLCGLAGGGGITTVAQLQSLLSSLGVNLSTTQVQNLLSQLGITDLASGLTQLELNRILQALGLGQTLPTG
jgi:hypothetical protein